MAAGDSPHAMVLPTIVVTAAAAPLIVAAICMFAYVKLDGGRHLLFWAIGHAGLPAAFIVVGFTDWQTAFPWYLLLPGMAGNLLATVMVAAGIRVLVGKPTSIAAAFLFTAILVLVAMLVHASLPPGNFAVSPFISSIFLLYGGMLLLRHRRSTLYTLVGIILLLRAAISLYYSIQLQDANADLNGAFSFSIFANLLTGLGLIMIEFDNARQRERLARDAEHKTRQFLETVLDTMPATMTFKDRDLRYRIINREMRVLLEPYGANLLGRTWSEIAGADAAAVVEEQDREILATGEPRHMEQGWKGADGRPTVVWALKVPLQGADGEIQGVVTCGIDITRLKDTETQLIEQREAAEAASRAKSTFLANMSHELRTPLNAIIGFAEMMKAGYLGTLTERQQEYAGNIHQSGEHLLRLVSDLLDLSRLESGKLEVNVTECDFDQIAAAALAMVEPQAKQAGVALEFEPAGLKVRADERALTQILINLLGNAVKFNRSDGRVRLQADSASGVTSIVVEDTGIGMSDAESRAAMQPLHRVDVYRARANSGAGLGLSICRSLIELHGGRLDIRSQPGQGTAIHIALPA